MTSSPSCLLSLKSSLPAPGAVWTTPGTLGLADLLPCYDPAVYALLDRQLIERPLVPEPRERGARHLLQYLVAGLELGQPRLEQVKDLTCVGAGLGVD